MNKDRATGGFNLAAIEKALLGKIKDKQPASGNRTEDDLLRDMIVDKTEGSERSGYSAYDGTTGESAAEEDDVSADSDSDIPSDSDGGMTFEPDGDAPYYAEETSDEAALETLEERYEEAHRISVDLTGDVFAAIGKAKARAKEEQEAATARVKKATAVVDDATGKLKIIEMRYDSSRELERIAREELGELPYVGVASIEDLSKQIDLDKEEVQALMKNLPQAEKAEVMTRTEALTALHATDAPEAVLMEKKKTLAFVEKRRNLTDYLLTVAKRNRTSMEGEDEYSAARREAAARNKDYFDAYREYAKAESALEDARLYAQEKKSAYESAHRETLNIRKRIDAFKELIAAEEKQLENMKTACEAYEAAYDKYLKRQKKRQARSRQLEAAREEYARLLDILAAAKADAEEKTERMYRTEKISVRDVIETNIVDEEFSYLNEYGAQLQRAQADEQNALGILRRARKKSQT